MLFQLQNKSKFLTVVGVNLYSLFYSLDQLKSPALIIFSDRKKACSPNHDVINFEFRL
jgi:hypothetical protein